MEMISGALASMRGRHGDAFSTYKRAALRDYVNSTREDSSVRLVNGVGKEIGTPPWKRSFPHVVVASLSSFLFGYHLSVVNETLESISIALSFNGNTMGEGLVVSTCLAGAFIGGAAAIWAYKKHKQKTSVHIMALNLKTNRLMDGSKPRMDLRRALDIEATNGVKLVRAQKDRGSIVCSFIVPERLSDRDGNWQAGAMATLIDSIGVGVNYYATGIFHSTVDLSISYLSTARIQEEVEIQVKVLGPRGKLSLVMVEIRKKEDGKLIALANQWLGSVKADVIPLSKI